jgi:hypothetical protein
MSQLGFMCQRVSRASAIVLVALFCVPPVVSAVIWLRGPRATARPEHGPAGKGDWQRPSKPEAIVIEPYQLGTFADFGASITTGFTGPIRDYKALYQVRESLEGRGQRALAAARKEFNQLPKKQSAEASRLLHKIGTLAIHEGRLDEATVTLEEALEVGRRSGIPAQFQRELTALLGVVALRRGEVENCIACLGPSSCIFPIAPEAVHTNTAGSREAVKHFTAYLDEVPGDLRVRWLLNIAYMTLGEYPRKVPPKFLIPLDTFHSKIDVGRFDNVAPLVGLTPQPGLAGGSVFDDFTGDGLPDLLVTSLDNDRGASLYVNRGDGTLERRCESAGLRDQVYALNVTAADYDNDGDLDVLLLRGGWQEPMRLSLLRNKGRGFFEDVTIAAGLATPIATESAAWGDYDNDGFVDVFVCGEFRSPLESERAIGADPRNRCRLYHNQGDGTFVDVAAAAGVQNDQAAKGCAWGDYDGDGWLDLFVSNMGGACRLYHNQNGIFRDVAPELGVTGPRRSFACWFWDYDNDGRLDLYVNDYLTQVAEVAAVALGAKLQRPSRPRLYRNLGEKGFREVTREVGLDRALAPMGCNFGDIDNDGYLDIYLGTGHMVLDSLVPNVMLKNVGGERFEDVTMSSGTGHLQKGHGISFADWDCDGDLDLFVEAGGGVPGDKAYNLLFQNPGHGRHWLKVKLVGAQTNRAALGARITAVVKGADCAERSIYRTVGNNSSFGGNSLVELIGLLDATSVAELEVSWPTSRTTQTFRDLAVDQMIEITEGAASFKRVPQPPLNVPGREQTPAQSHADEVSG